MEPPQLGESSRSPHRHSGSPRIPNGSHLQRQDQVEDRMSRLILGNWEDPPTKHIHPSHDLISLLHLDGLYNLYVRPYADALGPEEDIKAEEDGGEVKGKPKKIKKRIKLEKGYTSLLDDCIDPMPTGEQKSNLSIMPLIPDRLDLNFPQDPPDLGMRPMMLSDDVFANAYLETGQKVDGYENGVKMGVQADKERRDRRRQLRQAQMYPKSVANATPALPSPRDRTAPPTPGLPVHPPAPPYSNNPLRKPFLPPRPVGVPGTPGGPPRGAPPMRLQSMPGIGTPNGPPRGSPMSRPGGVPGTPGQRPFNPRPGPGVSTPRLYTPGGTAKRPGEPLQNANLKRSKPTGGSRSASPMPPQAGSYHPATQGRPGQGKQPRSRTEG